MAVADDSIELFFVRYPLSGDGRGIPLARYVDLELDFQAVVAEP